MRILALGSVILSLSFAVSVQATVPGAVDITCDVDRTSFLRAAASGVPQICFRLWDTQAGGTQCGTDQCVPLNALVVTKVKTDRFDSQSPRIFDRITTAIGSDANPATPCSTPETWLDMTVGASVFNCNISSRRRIASVPYATSAGSAPAASIVSGMIALWSGTIATIPSGWVLCDGTNGTPDLRDKFVIGATLDSAGLTQTNVTGVLTHTGGSATHTQTIAEMPAHHHSFTGFNDTATNGPFGTVTATSQVNTVNTTDVGGGQPMTIMNPYYALAFIMKQ